MAPWIVSGRVEKTLSFSCPEARAKSISPPAERPIQLRCMILTFSGQPVSWSKPPSRRSA